MADDRLKFLVQNFGGSYAGAGISQEDRSLKAPDRSLQPKVQQGNIFDKIKNVVGQTANIAGGVVAAGGKFVAHSAEDIVKSAYGAGKTLVDLNIQPVELLMANRNVDELNQREKKLNDDYRAGNISLDQYNETLKNIRGSREHINDRLKPISQGKTAGERNKEIAETVVNLLTIGRLSSVKAVGKEAAQESINGTLAGAASKIESALLRVPAAKELIERNAAQLATRQAQRLAGESFEQYMVREGKSVAAGLLIKRPLFYQQNIEDGSKIYHSMMHGEYGDALKTAGWMATQMIGGGPIGYFLEAGKKAGVKLRDLSFGRHSLIDTLSSQIGSGSSGQIVRYLNKLKEKAPEEYNKSVEVFRIMQETNLRVANEHVDNAVSNILRTYDQAGVDRNTIHPKDIVEDYKRWHEAALTADSLSGQKIEGMTPEQVNNLVVVRWDSVMKRGLANAFENTNDDRQAMAEVLSDFADRTMNGWGNNPNLMKQLTKIINESYSSKDAANKIRAIETATAIPKNLPKSVRNKLNKLGYGVAVPMAGVRKTPIVRLEDTRRLITAAIKGDETVFDITKEPQPTLQAIAGALSKSGLSPQAQNEQANKALRQSLAASLSGTEAGSAMGVGVSGDIDKAGAAVLSQLQRYVENKKPPFLLGKISAGKSAVTDIRMLRVNEIAEALGVTDKDAKDVQRAILDAYTKVPLELRGLGDRVVDYAFKYNPAQKHYARIQSALRYTYNPFFRAQEQIETAILSKMNADKFLWMQSRKDLDGAVDKLTRTGFFNGNMMSAAADDNVFGRISANMTKFQKRNLAGLALTIADRKGMTLDDMVNKFPEELDDALRVVVQYPNKGVLASSMARTLNLAFFPMRYNAKVTKLAADKLAQMPPSIQLGVIQGFMKMKEWLKSDEGIAWQTQHQDAIQVFKWATPVGSIEQFYKLATGNIQQPADLGLLGGLPFGIISQMLDSQGIIDMNTPYVNPTTGDQIPDYIPQTARARAAVAVNDLIGTMFSFPGRTLGLPGKEATLRKVVNAFIDTNGQDFDKQIDPDKLTPLQKKWVRVLKGDMSEQAVNDLYTSPEEGQFNYYTLPPMEMPMKNMNVPQPVDVLSRTDVANARNARKTPRRSELTARPIERP